MAKDIVILLDGTSNQISRKRSNVLRLYGTLKKTPEQVVYYDPGVGTFGADNAWSTSRRWLVELFGQATGYGLDENVMEAYRFLCTHYQHGEKGADGTRDSDRIWLFGFSRGAYSARVLAGFLHAFGLIAPEQFNLLHYAYRAYKSIGEGASDAAESAEVFAEIRMHERILNPTKPKIRCLGLFDTVASVIEPGRFWPRVRSHAFTSNNPSVMAVRQALAIDERRAMFRPKLWGEDRVFLLNPFRPEDSQPQDVKERWFAGVHGDIGGGYPEPESGLGKLTLEWMIEETRAMGLAYSTRTINSIVLGEGQSKYSRPDPLAPMHVSLKSGWWLLECIPGRTPKGAFPQGRQFCGLTFPLGAARTIPQSASIALSVTARMDADPDYRPHNLPQDP